MYVYSFIQIPGHHSMLNNDDSRWTWRLNGQQFGDLMVTHGDFMFSKKSCGYYGDWMDKMWVAVGWTNSNSCWVPGLPPIAVGHVWDDHGANHSKTTGRNRSLRSAFGALRSGSVVSIPCELRGASWSYGSLRIEFPISMGISGS